MSLTFTTAAQRFMQRMVMLGAARGFRLVVEPGGCSGLASTFTVESTPHAGDALVSAGDVTVFMPAATLALIDGATVDFAETATETGFTFQREGGFGCACSSSSAAGGASVSVIRFRER